MKAIVTIIALMISLTAFAREQQAEYKMELLAYGPNDQDVCKFHATFISNSIHVALKTVNLKGYFNVAYRTLNENPYAGYQDWSLCELTFLRDLQLKDDILKDANPGTVTLPIPMFTNMAQFKKKCKETANDLNEAVRHLFPFSSKTILSAYVNNQETYFETSSDTFMDNGSCAVNIGPLN